MKFYTFGERIIRSFLSSWKTEKKILGRWNLDSCHVKIGKKVDYSNHDHCGPCGIIPIVKQTPKSIPNISVKISDNTL